MAHIHWYPGHIAKAERKLKEQLNLVDVIFEVVDARIPLSSKYFEIQKLVADKPRLLIMNKSDVADPIKTIKFKEFYQKKYNLPTVATSTQTNKDLSSVISMGVELGNAKIQKLIEKGLLPRPVRAMVIGMPNVGKSSIINKLIKKSKTKTGAKAGVTRSSQWVRINPKLELLDTPGIIPMKMDNQQIATKLAFVNSVGENAYDEAEVAQELLDCISKIYPDALNTYYKQQGVPSLENIALARNWIISGGKPDIKRTASLILSDFRHGRIGKLTLDDTENLKN